MTRDQTALFLAQFFCDYPDHVSSRPHTQAVLWRQSHHWISLSTMTTMWPTIEEHVTALSKANGKLLFAVRPCPQTGYLVGATSKAVYAMLGELNRDKYISTSARNLVGPNRTLDQLARRAPKDIARLASRLETRAEAYRDSRDNDEKEIEQLMTQLLGQLYRLPNFPWNATVRPV